jgi:hypothetical protein
MDERSNGAVKKRSRSYLRKALSSVGAVFVNNGIYIFTITWVITIVLGFVGYYQYYQLNGMEISYSNILYDTLWLFKLRGGDLEWSNGYVLALDVARWTAVIVYFWAAALILSTALMRPLRGLRLWLCTDHVIVCGMGRVGSRFARAMSEEGMVVVIEKDKVIMLDDEAIRGNIIQVRGNATEEKVLRRAGIERATYVVTALEDDSANGEVAVQARRMVKGQVRDPLTCFVHIKDPDLGEVLRINEYNSDNPSIRLEFYNVVENGARTILSEFPAFQEGSVKKDGLKGMVVIGLDDIGRELVLRAAKRWWPRYQATEERLPIVLVGPDVGPALEFMCASHPNLGRACTFETVVADVRKLKVANDDELRWLMSDNPSCIYVCVPNDSDGLSLALMLRKRLGDEGGPIVVILNADSRPAALLGEEGRNAGVSNVYTFGFWDRTCTKALIQYGSREVMGQAIHEEYCLEQQARDVPTEASCRSWDKLGEELKRSNRSQADHIIVKARAIGCKIESLTDWGNDASALTPYEVHKLSRMEHDRWCNDMLRKGWRYGKVRDDAHKVHDDLCPWSELTDETKYKDIATVKKIPRILARVELRLVHQNMTLQVAKALLIENNKLSRKRKSGDNQISSSWNEIEEVERAPYLDEAREIIDCCESIGCGITGRGSVEEEVGNMNSNEVELMNGRFSAYMAQKGRVGLAADASTWPKILSTVDLAIFRYKDARKSMEVDRGAMLMAFTANELEGPFLPR